MTKEQLRLYRSLKIEIDHLEDRIVRLDMTGHNDDIIKPLREVYRKKLAVLIEGQLSIEKAIESLSPTERELIRLRYVDGAEWAEIGEVLHYEWAQTHRIHARALDKIKDL